MKRHHMVLVIIAAMALGPGVILAGAQSTASAVFAGGCFWSMQSAMEKVYGVISVQSGYTGGTSRNPNYDNYEAGGHVEAVQILYDPSRVSYERAAGPVLAAHEPHR